MNTPSGGPAFQGRPATSNSGSKRGLFEMHHAHPVELATREVRLGEGTAGPGEKQGSFWRWGHVSPSLPQSLAWAAEPRGTDQIPTR